MMSGAGRRSDRRRITSDSPKTFRHRMKNVHNPSIPRIAVVGGGISGLAAAHRILELSKQLNRTVDLQLLEAGGRLGGVIHTSERDGFLLEGGPDSFHFRKAVGLIPLPSSGTGAEPHWHWRQPTGEASLSARASCSQFLTASIFWHQRAFGRRSPHRFSVGPARSGCRRIWSCRERNVPQQRRMKVLADFVRRRLGQEALDRMAQPMIGGIYTSDPEELSLRATMPRFLDMEQEHRSLILAMWRQRQKTRNSQNHQAAGPRYGLFVSLDQGMVRLVEALQKRLPPDSIHLNTQVSALRKKPLWAVIGFWISQMELSSKQTPFVWRWQPSSPRTWCKDSTRSLQPGCAAFATRRQQRSISHIPWKTFPAPWRGLDLSSPPIEKREILACTFSHMKFSGRAPRNHALLRAFMGGALQPKAFDYEDREMIQIVRQNLRELLGIEKPPLFALVERHARAMAQYRVGHLDLVAEIEALAKQHPTLQLAGNGFTGIGIPDCIRRGEECAGRHPGGARSFFPRLTSSRPAFLIESLNSVTEPDASSVRDLRRGLAAGAEQPKSIIPAKGGLVPLVRSEARSASAPLAWRTTNTTIAVRRPAPTLNGCVSVACEWLQTKPAYTDEKQHRADKIHGLGERCRQAQGSDGIVKDGDDNPGHHPRLRADFLSSHHHENRSNPNKVGQQQVIA